MALRSIQKRCESRSAIHAKYIFFVRLYIHTHEIIATQISPSLIANVVNAPKQTFNGGALEDYIT